MKSSPKEEKSEGTQKDNKNEVKLQFRCSSDAVERLDEIVKKSHLVSRADLIRNSVRLYEYIIEQIEEGYEVELVKGRKRRKIVLLST